AAASFGAAFGKAQPFRTSGGEAAMAGDAMRQIWHRNQMLTRAGEVHNEALKTGDAYVIVWPDNLGRARLFPNRAANVTVVYDDDEPGRIVMAAKWWRTTEKFIRLNLFYPDRVEKYTSKEKGEGTLPDTKGFVPLGVSALQNPYDVVPVFHFANNA